ncbi:MAG: oligosaccharide flippase family protein [Candidatus Zixiibacteriota bacterium]
MKRQFAKNLSSNWVVYAVSALISIALTPYIIAKLGKAAYGVWILVGSFSSYLGLFDFGIGYAVVRFVARYQKTGESEKRNEVIATSFYTAALLAVIVLAATAFLAVKAASLFDIPPELVRESQAVIALVGLSIAFAFPMGIFSEALAGGLWRFDLFNKVSLTISIARTALTVLLLELGWGLPGLGLAVLAGSIVGYTWRARMLYRLLPDLSIKLRLVSLRVFHQIGDYTLFSFILVLSGRISFYSDSFIVGLYRGVEDIAIFGIAVKLTEYLRQLVFTLTKLFSPVASRYNPDSDKASLRRLFYTGTRLNLLFAVPLAAGLFFWGGPIIRLWIGPSFDYSKVILQILLIGHVLSFTQGVSGEILLGVGRHRVFAVLSLISAIVNIVLSVILVQKMGLVGVAWGTTIPLTILSLAYLPAATLRLVEGKIEEFIRQSLIPVTKATIGPLVIIIAASYHLNSYWYLAGYAAITGLIYGLTAYIWGLTEEEKGKIRSEISHFRV